MKKLALGALFVGLTAACGGGGGGGPMLVDSGTEDAPPTGACSPTAQTGCQPGEKCTWIIDNEDPFISHVGCAPDGTVETFGACTRQDPGQGGSDNCKAGDVCLSGTCKPICDTNGGDPLCPTNYACVRYADVLEDGGGNSLGGICEPGCDPLTQKLLVGGAEACGSADPTNPNLGCYGITDFSCSRAGDIAKTDGVEAAENGTVYLNSCAPGYLPLFNKSTTEQVGICNGLCAAQPIDINNTTISGNASAEGKLPTEAMAKVGDATCGPTKKGRAGQSTCLYMYAYVADDSTGAVPASFEPYVDTLGFCMMRTDYDIDHDQDPSTDPIKWGTDDGCQSLPPTAPQGEPAYMGADFWWCQPAEEAALTGTPKKRARAPFSFGLEEVELRRHTLR